MSDRGGAMARVADTDGLSHRGTDFVPMGAVPLALHLLERFDAYRPKPVPSFPQRLMNMYPSSLGEHEDFVIDIWSKHRVEVTRIEAENAGRLHMLLRGVRTLHAAGKRGDETAAEGASELLRKTLSAFAGYRDSLRGQRPDFSERTLRRVCPRATRDYLSLPPEWRELSVVRKDQRRRVWRQSEGR